MQAAQKSLDIFAPLIERVVAETCSRLRRGGTVYFFGNGGSAADALHFVGEFTGRFLYDRPPLRAAALEPNLSSLTAIGNDYSYEDVFARPLAALGRPEDVAFGLTTSGNSPNVLKAMQTAASIGMFRVGMTGGSGGRLPANSDVCFIVPVKDTPRVQEVHGLVGHVICELVEREMFPKP